MRSEGRKGKMLQIMEKARDMECVDKKSVK